MKKAIFLGLFLTLAVPLTSFAAFDMNLKYGSSGPAVKEMQEFLVDQGACSITPTGNFFALTLKCVKAFQTTEGISPVSGFWGPLTRAKASDKLDLSASDDDEKAQTGAVTTPDTTTDSQKLISALAAIKAAQDAQTNAVKDQTVALGKTQIQQQVTTQTTAPVPTTPAAVYSINITSPIEGSLGDRYHYYYAKVGIDNQFTFALYKGPVTIDAYRAEEYSDQGLNPSDTPVVAEESEAGIRITNSAGLHFNNSGNDVGTSYTTYGGRGSFIIHPIQLGDIPVTLIDSKDNVTKDIVIHAQE